MARTVALESAGALRRARWGAHRALAPALPVPRPGQSAVRPPEGAERSTGESLPEGTNTHRVSDFGRKDALKVAESRSEGRHPHGHGVGVGHDMDDLQVHTDSPSYFSGRMSQGRWGLVGALASVVAVGAYATARLWSGKSASKTKGPKVASNDQEGARKAAWPPGLRLTFLLLRAARRRKCLIARRGDAKQAAIHCPEPTASHSGAGGAAPAAAAIGVCASRRSGAAANDREPPPHRLHRSQRPCPNSRSPSPKAQNNRRRPRSPPSKRRQRPRPPPHWNPPRSP
jgi:hypothetical protein